MTQSRFRNGGLWLSLVSLAILLLTQMGFGDYIPVGIFSFCVGVVGVFTFLGIVSNAKDGKFFWNPNTPWSVRCKDYAMWVGIAGLLASLVAQILIWFHLMPLPFNLIDVFMTFLAILQATGIISGQPVEIKTGSNVPSQPSPPPIPEQPIIPSSDACFDDGGSNVNCT